MDLYHRVNVALEKVIVHLKSTESGLKAIAVRGSYVTERMTSTSDVDMFIIKDEVGPEQFHHYQDDIDFHIRRYPEEYFKHAIAENNLRYIGFFQHAKPLYDPFDVFKKIKSIIDNKSLVDIASTPLSDAEHQVNDAIGQIAKGDYQTALYLIRHGAHLLSQALLLMTKKATYKHKDVVGLLRESPELKSFHDDLITIMDLEVCDSQFVENKLEQFKETISNAKNLIFNTEIKSEK